MINKVKPKIFCPEYFSKSSEYVKTMKLEKKIYILFFLKFAVSFETNKMREQMTATKGI